MNWDNIVTCIVAIVSLLCSLTVTILNNHHNRSMRKLDFERDVVDRVTTTYYEDKKEAFSNFLIFAGIACTDEQLIDEEHNFYSYAQTAILFASKENKKLISDFTDDIMKYLNTNMPLDVCQSLKNKLTVISEALGEELADLRANFYDGINRI